MGMESSGGNTPKVKLNAYGELIGESNDSPESSDGYINEKGEFIREMNLDKKNQEKIGEGEKESIELLEKMNMKVHEYEEKINEEKE